MDDNWRDWMDGIIKKMEDKAEEPNNKIKDDENTRVIE
jgi:hypothetical protein